MPITSSSPTRKRPSSALSMRTSPLKVWRVISFCWAILLGASGAWRRAACASRTLRALRPPFPSGAARLPQEQESFPDFVGELREEVAKRIQDPAAIRWLEQECGLPRVAAEQAAAYVAAGCAALGGAPTRQHIVAERFFDEGGGMQLVIHSPLGGRLNRAWGLALRKCFCRSFNFELQAAATDDGLLLSLGEQHSFPLEMVFTFLHSNKARDVLTQALLASPMFTTRWRWNASRFLAVLRFAAGKKVPMPLQRMRAEDLMAVVFPGALACRENIPGDIPIPDHPLSNETIHDCLTEAMDIDGLIEVLKEIEGGKIECVALDTPEPSPFCHEILNANPYAFLDDAPLEERRARAVMVRRTLSRDLGDELGRLDPAAIREICEEAWSSLAGARSADELHDALLTVGWLPELNGEGLTSKWEAHLHELLRERRATRATLIRDGVSRTGWVAAERLTLVTTALPELTLEFPLHAVPTDSEENIDKEEAAARMVRGWLTLTGPVTVNRLAELIPLSFTMLATALARSEATGQILQGRYTPGFTEIEWCDRRLLARIHRLTLERLRKEVEPVSPADFMRFLLRWQHTAPGTRLHGEAGLLAVLRQLQGCEVAAAAWEAEILPARVSGYDPQWLDRLCFGGEVGWARLSPHPASFQPNGQENSANGKPANKKEVEKSSKGSKRRIQPTRLAPITLFRREEMPWLFFRGVGEKAAAEKEALLSNLSRSLSPAAEDVHRCLTTTGASFFNDLVTGTERLKAEVEQALWELVMAGLVTADGFDPLRALVDPKRRRAEGRGRTARPRHSTGRWSLLRTGEAGIQKSEWVERTAEQLLSRYGVVFHTLLSREVLRPAWHDLLQVYRRWEAQGRIRGGRFVSGFTGEQYALPEAVEALRALRRLKGEGEEVTLSAGDPLNLVGVLLPGERTSAASGKYIRFRDGVPITLAEEEAEAPRASPVPSPTYSAYSKLSRRSELNSSRSPSR